MFVKLTMVLIITAASNVVATGNLNTTFLQGEKVMSEQIKTKRCSKCKQIKSISEFSKNHTRKDGHQYVCRQCRKQYYQTNKAEIRQNHQQYQKTHKAGNRHRQKRYYQKIRGHLRGVWSNILQRCNNPKCKSYKNYGGRSIQNKFKDFEHFYDYVVNELNVDPRGLTIDRIDNNGHYERGNIRFVTQVENLKNRRLKCHS